MFLDFTLKEVFDKIKNKSTFLEKNEVAQGIVAPQDFLNKENAKNENYTNNLIFTHSVKPNE